MQIRSIGIDLGKTTFHLIALGTRSQVVIRRKFSRSRLLVYTSKLTPSLIGMEAGEMLHCRADPKKGRLKGQTAQFTNDALPVRDTTPTQTLTSATDALSWRAALT